LALLRRPDRARQDRDQLVSLSNECVQLGIDNKRSLLSELQPVQRFAYLLVGDPELVNEIRETLRAASLLVVRSAAGCRSHELSCDVLGGYFVRKPTAQPDRTRSEQPQTRSDVVALHLRTLRAASDNSE
jgi:hypothetical protein